jgi:hypothetical protein
MSATGHPIPPCPAGLDRKSPAYLEAVRVALADAPSVSPDVHARLRAILARPTGNIAEACGEGGFVRPARRRR